MLHHVVLANSVKVQFFLFSNLISFLGYIVRSFLIAGFYEVLLQTTSHRQSEPLRRKSAMNYVTRVLILVLTLTIFSVR